MFLGSLFLGSSFLECGSLLSIVRPLKVLDMLRQPSQAERHAGVPEGIQALFSKIWVSKTISRARKLLSPDAQAQLVHQARQLLRRGCLFFLLLSRQESTHNRLDLNGLVALIKAAEMTCEPEVGSVCKGRHCI